MNNPQQTQTTGNGYQSAISRYWHSDEVLHDELNLACFKK